ncbi:SCP2 sterol-binding domain-containing protein [Pueribacillus sp. YX66]|uniref:SCP2 sterol-binding domain-containing protein n=1 Tax=Pueribacillus sp. YX66 TaxID=3229242 RepID=UPI00358D6C68
MQTTKDIFDMIKSEMERDYSQADGIEATFQFNITGDDAGTYQVILGTDSGSVVEGDQEEADCTITMDSEDFKKMVDGELNGTEAFMGGQLQIDGDMGLALRLQDILSAYSGD